MGGDHTSYSGTRLLDALAKVPAHVAILAGPGHVYAFVNDAYARIVGVDDPLGTPFGVSNHDDAPRLRAILDDVYTSGVPFTFDEVPIPNRAETRYFNVNFIPLRGEDGAIDGILLHSFDVTDLVLARRAEQEKSVLSARLLDVQKLESLGLLAGGIAHDFNNMLSAIQGSIAAAALMLTPDSPAQVMLRDGIEASRRAADLTRQLLAYSGKGQFRVIPTDLSRHVAELAHLVETTLSRKVQLRLELRSDLPAVLADPAQIQQVVMNLIINGAEAIGEDRGTVYVTTTVEEVDAVRAASFSAAMQPGRYVSLEVRDTGCGMDEATTAKIFDPFFTTKFTGRGLGLAAVHGIVRAHGGGIEVRSTPGGGSTFRVLFKTTTQTVEHPDAIVGRAPHGSGIALVIDDDEGVRRVLRHMLEYYGFTVVEAADGRHGVEVFGAHAAEVKFVILDMTMPDLSGEETFRELRKVRADVRVILSSGYDEVEASRHFMADGLAAFLPKPFTPDELARCIRTAIDEP